MPGEKQSLRERAAAARESQPDKDGVSRVIIDRTISLPQYAESSVVMWYVDVRDEVRTQHALPAALETEKTIVVPYCVGQSLALFRLESMDDLVPGKYGILEPTRGLRQMTERSISPDLLDLILVPGVAFDPRGGRLGHGKGYYDRLLSIANKPAVKIGVAYDCQLVDHVPMDEHDVTMDIIVTETMLVSLR